LYQFSQVSPTKAAQVEGAFALTLVSPSSRSQEREKEILKRRSGCKVFGPDLPATSLSKIGHGATKKPVSSNAPFGLDRGFREGSLS